MFHKDIKTEQAHSIQKMNTLKNMKSIYLALLFSCKSIYSHLWHFSRLAVTLLS